MDASRTKRSTGPRLAHPPASSRVEAIAQATVDLFREVASRLVPVIGARGIEAIFGRALRETRKSYPWIWISAGNGYSSNSWLAGLGITFDIEEPAQAAEAGSALLFTFIGLLKTLIGAPLTDRLLDPIKADTLFPEHGHDSRS